MAQNGMVVTLIVFLVLLAIIILTKLVLDYLDKHPETEFTISVKIGPTEYVFASKQRH